MMSIRSVISLAVAATGLAVAGSSLAATSGRYLSLEDAAVAQAKAWQKGDKAKPIMADDGKVLFAYGQSMPRLTCSPTRACDVEMQAGEQVKQVVLGDKQNWTWSPADSVEKGKPVQHVVIQPRDSAIESNLIVTTNRRTYHIKLFAPKKEGLYLNRVGFYYPEDLVSEWASKAEQDAETQTANDDYKVTDGPVEPESLDFDYRIKGDDAIRPVRVYNNGNKVYVEMPKDVDKFESPAFILIDDDGKEMPVNWRPKGRFYISDRLFTRAEMRLGSARVTIVWSKKAKWYW